MPKDGYTDKLLKRTSTAHCIKGHLYDEKNTIVNRNDYPKCRKCLYDRRRLRRGL